MAALFAAAASKRDLSSLSALVSACLPVCLTSACPFSVSCRAGWCAAVTATFRLSPAVSPAQAAVLLEEANAAYKRCKAVLPPAWANVLKDAHAAVPGMRPIIEGHLARSPGHWQQDILNATAPAFKHATQKLQRELAEQPRLCDACGLLVRCLRPAFHGTPELQRMQTAALRE